MFAYILARQKPLARQLYRRLVGVALETGVIDRSSGYRAPVCALQIGGSSGGGESTADDADDGEGTPTNGSGDVGESPAGESDDASQPASRFEPARDCPRCGEPMVGVTSTGPHTHVISPCGCRTGGVPDGER